MGDWSIWLPESGLNCVLNPSAETTGNYAARNAALCNRDTTYQWRGPTSYHIQAHQDDVEKQNLITNPSCETNVTGWAGGVFVAEVRSTTDGQSGTCCFEGTVEPTKTNYLVDIPQSVVNPAQGVTYTFSVYIKNVSCTGNVYLSLQETGGGTGMEQTRSNTNYPWPAGWTRVTVSHTILQADRTALICRVRSDTVVAGEVALLDAAQLEVSAAATTYLDGSLGYSYAWTGTAHASTSWRYNLSGGDFTLSALANAPHYVHLMMYPNYAGVMPVGWVWSVDGTNWTTPTLLETIGSWYHYGCAFPAAQCNASTTLRIAHSGIGTSWYHIDAIQVEAKAYWTSYCDGDQPGCYWNGVAHASTSTRSAQYRGGGRLYDIEDTYGVYTTMMSGFGLQDPTLNIQEGALLDGGWFQGSKVGVRTFVLVFAILAATGTAYHLARSGLSDAFSRDLVSPEQPVTLRWTGGTQPAEIEAYYAGGLEGQADANWQYVEKMAAKFVAVAPDWRWAGDSVTALNTTSTVPNDNYIIQRRAGIWQALGTGVAGGQIYALAAPSTYRARTLVLVQDPETLMTRYYTAPEQNPTTTLYAGGGFTAAGGVADGNGVAMWDGAVWSAMATGVDGATVVSCLLVAPDGTVYAGGSFATMSGVPNTVNIAKWNGAAWLPLGSGMTGGNVAALAMDIDGNLYAGGTFTQAGGVANTTRLARWGTDGAWHAVGTGVNGEVTSLACTSRVDPTTGIRTVVLWIGGLFTTVNGTGSVNIAKAHLSAAYAPTVLTTIGPANNYVWSLLIARDGTVYAGGDFTTIGPATLAASRIARYNGSSWFALGNGCNLSVYSLAEQAGSILVGGIFTTAGGTPLADAFAIWDGTRWRQPWVDLPGTPDAVFAILTQGDRITLGHTGTGTATIPGSTTVTNSGKKTAYPQIKFKRVGGTTATVAFLLNATTGDRIWLDYGLQDGETLTIDLTPGRKDIVSDYRGSVMGIVSQPGGAFSKWGLQRGANTIQTWVAVTGAPTITAWLEFRPVFATLDGA
jgi:hypothetical protein